MSKRKKRRVVIAIFAIIAVCIALISGYPLFGVGNSYTVVNTR